MWSILWMSPILGCSKSTLLSEELSESYCEVSLECELVEGESMAECSEITVLKSCVEEAEALYECLAGVTCEEWSAEDIPSACQAEWDAEYGCNLLNRTE